MDVLDRLLDHDSWAMQTLLTASQSLSDAQLDQPFDIGHETVRATFAHVIFNIEAWTGGLQGEPEITQDESRLSLDELRTWHERSFLAFAAFARDLRDSGRMDETLVDEDGHEMSLGGGILHVVIHNLEHRAEIVHMLTRLGLTEPPVLDHGFWDMRRLTP